MPTKESLEADTAEAVSMGNKYPCDVRGRFPWDRSERNGRQLTLSKASLGDFVYAVLSNGGDVSSFFCLNHNYSRASVFSRVRLSLKAKKKIEEDTAFRFDPPPVPHLN